MSISDPNSTKSNNPHCTDTDSHWRSILRNNIRSYGSLTTFLEWNEEELKNFLPNPKFTINIPLRLAHKIQKNNPHDPILRQFIPLKEEKETKEGFCDEPVQDFLFSQGGTLLQKYTGRALLVSTGVCAMHCRYCFRQNFDYQSKSAHFEKELDILRKNSSISEVILSGGDPLSLSTHKLRDLLEELIEIKHLEIIRVHTRFPIGIPERITKDLLNALENVLNQKKQIIFVIHVNHVRELDDEVFTSLQFLQRIGIPILNQSVLLKGINDTVEALYQLNYALITHGILPYYLHQLDRVQGTAHFEVDPSYGLHLIEELRKTLPGYAVPQYVQEIPGKRSKTPIQSIS